MVELNPANAVPIHVVPNAAFVFRYMVAIHAITCFVVLLQNFALHLRPTEESRFVNKLILWGCLIVPAVQLPISIFRVVSSLAPEFSLKNPLEAYLNFFWSPMCTIYLVWLVQVYMATTCKTTLCRYDPKDVLASPNKITFAFSVICGVIFSHLFYAYLGIMDNHNVDLQLRISVFLALIIVQLEASYHHGLKRISLVSYGISFFAGSWVYFLRFVR